MSSVTRVSWAERSERADRAILRAATTLISRQGYSKTTLAQIGAEAGYSAGLVSHRFGSKEGLLRELVGRITSRFYEDQILPAVHGRTGVEAICAFVEAYLGELLLREERMRALYVLMGETLGPVAEVRAIFAELDKGFRDRVRQWLEEGLASGEIRRGIDPAVEAAIVVGQLRGTALQWLIAPQCFDLAAARDAVQASVRRSLAP